MLVGIGEPHSGTEFRLRRRPNNSSRMVGSSVLVGSSRMSSGTCGTSTGSSATLRFMPRRQLRQRPVEVDVELLGQRVDLAIDRLRRAVGRGSATSCRPVMFS